MSLPGWRFVWVRWKLGHGEFKRHGPGKNSVRPGPPVPPPNKIPNNVLNWYYRTFAKEIAALDKPTTPAPNISSVFHGIGGFTSHDPRVAIRKYRGLVDIVAVHADGQDKEGTPYVTQAVVNDLLDAGFKVVPWFSWDHQPTGGMHWLNGIGQAEGPGQLNQCIETLPRLCDGELAIVTNNFMNDFPSIFYALPESYMNVNPQSKPGSAAQDSINRGAQKERTSPVFGCYVSNTEGAVDVPLKNYVNLWSKKNFWIYLLETMAEKQRDLDYLRSIR